MISTGGVEWTPRWPGNLADVITYNSTGGGNGSTPANGLGPVDFQHLSQNQYGRMMMALSEGEIGGLVNGLKSIYLDGTALQNSDNTFNFTGVSLALVHGSNTQGMIPGFTSVENEVAGAASLPVKVSILGGAITRTVSTTGLSAIRVKIASPTLKKIATDGTESAVAVQLRIELQSPNYNSGAWFTAWGPAYDGKFNDRFVYNCRVNLPAAGPWQVRVTRLTPDHTSGSPDFIQDETWWDGYTEIQDVMLRYPNTAVLAAMVNAKQFPSIPTLHAECYGVKVLVPRNYDPATRTYYTTGNGTTGGVWDGTFGDRISGTIGQKVWTNNPAWLFMDLATNERYGAGNYLSTANVDKYALYNISQICDQMVSDGKGGTEPRFACSIHYQQQEDAIKVLSNLASAFRGMLYSSGGMVVPVQDVDGQPVALFTKSNVINGEFSYQGSARSARHTAVMVSWLDPNAGYVKTVEYVEDVAAIVQYGLQIAQVEHIGCTSQAQAQRFGNFILATEKLCTETVSFSAGLDSSVVHPGDIIQIADHDRTQSARAAGRVVDATTTSVTVDSPVILEGGKTYLLKCRMASGSVESKTITNGAGETLVLNVGSAFSTAPPVQGVWMIHESGVSKLYRVVNIREMDPLTYSITALLHDPAKYSDTVNLTVTGATVTTLSAPVVTLVSTTRTLKSRIASVITASWPSLAKAIGYQAEYSSNGGPWEPMRVNGTTADVIDVVTGSYRVRVVALYPGGKASLFTESTIAISDPSTLPTSITPINDRAFWPLNRIQNPSFAYSLEPWKDMGTDPPVYSTTTATTGTGSALQTVTAPSGVNYASKSGSIYQPFSIPKPGTGQTATLSIKTGFGTTAANATYTGDVRAYLMDCSTGVETLITNWTYTTTQQALAWTARTFDMTSMVPNGGDFVLRVQLDATADSSTAGAKTSNLYVDEIKIVL